MGRFGTPADVAATVSWLASDKADDINGQTIAMPGAERPTQAAAALMHAHAAI